MLLALTKIEERHDAEVPNNTIVGDVRHGKISDVSRLPRVGSSFVITYNDRFGGRQTSIVTDIIEEWDGVQMMFRTLNSVYKLKLLKEGDLNV